MGHEKKPSTGESDTSTSTEKKKASANLNKNVEECRLNKNSKDAAGLKDDVMGSFVTANNADAKLSSLMHDPKERDGNRRQEDKTKAKGKPEEQSSSSGTSSDSKAKKKNGNESSDSGYRANLSPEESNEFAEDGSSSFGSSSGSNSDQPAKKPRRSRPLAPACNIRLIRNDLTTIWCELTSSIRTRPPNDEDEKANITAPVQAATKSNTASNPDSMESTATSEGSEVEEKELLLCFRPIREGDNVTEDLRFKKRRSFLDDSNEGVTSNKSSSTDAAQAPSKLIDPATLTKKCCSLPRKRKFGNISAQLDDNDEQSAAESMINLRQSSA